MLIKKLKQLGPQTAAVNNKIKYICNNLVVNWLNKNYCYYINSVICVSQSIDLNVVAIVERFNVIISIFLF